MFHVLKLMFHVLQHKFHVLQHKFHVLEHKILRREETFSPRDGIFRARTFSYRNTLRFQGCLGIFKEFLPKYFFVPKVNAIFVPVK